MRISTRIGLGAAGAFAAAGLTAGIAGAAVPSDNHTVTAAVIDSGKQVQVTVDVDKDKGDQDCVVAIAPAASATDQDLVAQKINGTSSSASAQDVAAAEKRLATKTLVKKNLPVTAGTPATEAIEVPIDKPETSYAVSVTCEKKAATGATAGTASEAKQHVATVLTQGGSAQASPTAPTGNGSIPDSLTGILGDELPGALTGVLDSVLSGIPAV